MYVIRKLGSTSNILRATLRSSVNGQGLTGLAYGSSGLIISTICDNEAAAKAYTTAASTIETIATLGTFAAPTATECRFREVDATNHPGLYEFQFDDARFAVAGSKLLRITVSGVTNLLMSNIIVQLSAVSMDDGVRFGMTALPSYAAGAPYGLPTLNGSGTATETLNTAKLSFATMASQNYLLATGMPWVAVSGLTSGDVGGNGSYAPALVGATDAVLFANGQPILYSTVNISTNVQYNGTAWVLNIHNGNTYTSNVAGVGGLAGTYSNGGLSCTVQVLAVPADLSRIVQQSVADPGGAVTIPQSVGTGTSTLTAGAKMDLVDAPNATAVTAIGAGVWGATTRTLSSFGFTVNANDASGNPLATSATMAAGFLTINNNIALGTTNTRRLIVTIPSELYIPATGSCVYWIDAYLQDDTETPLDPDSNTITVHAALMDGTSMDSRLVHSDGSSPGTVLLARIAAGHYRAYVLIEDTDTPQPLSFSGSFAVSSVTKNFGGVVDLDYAASQPTLKAIQAKTDLIATAAADSPNAVAAQGTIAGKLDVAVGSRLAAADYTAPDNPAAVEAIQAGLAVAAYQPAYQPTVDSSGKTAVKYDWTNDVTSKPTIGDATAASQALQATAANQTTILNRLGAFTGSGWNTVLGFFRALMRGDNGVTLPTDVGGTYVNTVDSLEAIAAKPSGGLTDEEAAQLTDVQTNVDALATIGGMGAYALTVTVTDGTNPIGQAMVRMTKGVVSNLLQANSSGQAAFALDAGDWTLTGTAAGYQGTSQSVTVTTNPTQTATYTMTAITIPAKPGNAPGDVVWRP